jgi:hypothetical protein
MKWHDAELGFRPVSIFLFSLFCGRGGAAKLLAAGYLSMTNKIA